MKHRSGVSRKIDPVFLLIFLFLLIFGLVMLASASAPTAFIRFGDEHYFVKNQLLFGLLPGSILFLIALRLKSSFWKKIAWLPYFASVILLVMVFIPHIGMYLNGARSWISIGGHSFQPSEMFKLSLVIVLASMLSEPRRIIEDWKTGLLPILAVVGLPAMLIACQTDIGTLLIISMIVFGMLYFGGARLLHLAVIGLAAVAIFCVLILAAPKRVDRLKIFLHPELDPQGIGYQTDMANLAVGSGGWFGLGLGNSRQKYQYLPETHGDSIFAIIAEETGFFVSCFFVFMLVAFAFRGMKIAKATPDKFARLLILGIMVWFIGQSFLNIGAVIGLLPLTGVPLPFVSHGGSALMSAMAGAGIVLSISKE